MVRVPWKESNLALIGSALDHKVKQAAAEHEEQWKGVGEEKGTKVWRIEKFCVVPWPQAKYGKFHTGDSYVVLHSYTKPGRDKLLHDLHIWIGKESSQVRGLQKSNISVQISFVLFVESML
jgi:gelsolin